MRILAGITLAVVGLVAQASTQPNPVTIAVDAAAVRGPMTPIWAWFGNDEPNYAYMRDGQKLLTELSNASPVPVHFRTHNLLTRTTFTRAGRIRRRLWSASRAGEIDQARLDRAQGRLMPTHGTCMVMGTASTMACLAETLGFVLPGGASETVSAVPAVPASERASVASREA